MPSQKDGIFVLVFISATPLQGTLLKEIRFLHVESTAVGREVFASV